MPIVLLSKPVLYRLLGKEHSRVETISLGVSAVEGVRRKGRHVTDTPYKTDRIRKCRPPFPLQLSRTFVALPAPDPNVPPTTSSLIFPFFFSVVLFLPFLPFLVNPVINPFNLSLLPHLQPPSSIFNCFLKVLPVVWLHCFYRSTFISPRNLLRFGIPVLL